MDPKETVVDRAHRLNAAKFAERGRLVGAIEPRHDVLVAGVLRVDLLDDDFAIELFVVGKQKLAHLPFVDLPHHAKALRRFSVGGQCSGPGRFSSRRSRGCRRSRRRGSGPVGIR